VAFTERLSAQYAAELLMGKKPPLAVDVRSAREHEQKYIDGSVSMPLSHLKEDLEKLPKDRPLLVHCAGGYRSSIAASMLKSGGFERVSEIAGGISAWEAAKLPVRGALHSS
jgi:hydroxyacylglutathione hydrolase